MDQPPRRFGVPGDAASGGLIGGAVVLGSVAIVGIAGIAPTGPGTVALAVAGIAALGVVLASAVSLVRVLRSAEAALDESTHRVEVAASRMKLLVEHVPAAVYIDEEDPSVSDGGRLSYMSPQVAGILGFSPEELVGNPELWPSRIHPDDRDAAVSAYEAHWRTGLPLQAEYRMLARDGTEVWVRDEAYALPDTTHDGRRVSQGLLVDTTERKLLEVKLTHDALHDPLTRLANRVLFRDHLERALVRRRRGHETVGLLFIDLDDFKVVNDTFGHGSGDEVLVQVAGRLLGAIRAEDIAARQGGDEFTILLGQVRGIDEAVASAERIVRDLRRPIQLGAISVTVGGSVGIALADRATTADDLLTHADSAMYAAKAAGKGGHAVYGVDTPIRVVRRLEAVG